MLRIIQSTIRIEVLFFSTDGSDSRFDFGHVKIFEALNLNSNEDLQACEQFHNPVRHFRIDVVRWQDCDHRASQGLCG
jgi:hypothetical protein